MSEKEFLDEDMYITTRDANPVICEKCNQITTTHIRVPSLNDYFSWCENCKSIPVSSWEKSNYENLINNFKLHSSYTIKAIKSLSNKKFNDRQLDLFLSYLESGYSKKEAYKQTLSESKKYSKELLFSTQVQKSDIDSIDINSEVDLQLLQTSEYSIYSSFQADIIIDFNKIVKSILSNLSEIERKTMAILFEEYQIDEILFQSIRDKLYEGIDTKEITRYTKLQKSRFLGLSTKNKVQYKLNKIETTLLRKLKIIFQTKYL